MQQQIGLTGMTASASEAQDILPWKGTDRTGEGLVSGTQFHTTQDAGLILPHAPGDCREDFRQEGFRLQADTGDHSVDQTTIPRDLYCMPDLPWASRMGRFTAPFFLER